MRFWLTLILGTVVVSSGLTFLTLHQGGQTITRTEITPPPPPNIRPEISFDLEPGMMQIANGLEAKKDSAKFGETHNFSVKCKNQGNGDLTLRLIRVQPEEMEVRFNGKTLANNDTVTLKPGEKGEIFMKWPVNIKIGRGQKPEGYHFRAEFDWNDHRFDDPLLVEVIQRIRPD